MHLLVVWRGVFGFGVLSASAQLVCVKLLHVFYLHCVRVRIYRPVHVFDYISFGLLLDKFTSC